LFPFLLLPVLFLALAGCATTPNGFPLSKNGPTPASTTTPSACLEKGKEAEGAGDWATAYCWYARGGGWNVRGRSTGFPSPGTLSEPEESQRFLCIVAFREATQHLIDQGIRVDANGVHPIYVSLSEANQSLAYFRNAHPGGYAGMTAAQMKALQKESTTMAGVTMDSVEQVDRGHSHLENFQKTITTASERSGRARGTAPEVPGGHPAPAIIPGKPGSHAEAARLYREAATKYPENDSRREEMLRLAGEEEQAAAAEKAKP
jgi:hypothetical protein